MKLKVTDIALIGGAVLVVGLLVYNITGTSEIEQDDKALSTQQIQISNERSISAAEPDNRRRSKFSDDPDKLRQQIRNADDAGVKDFVRFILDQPLPADFVIPQYITDAGSVEKSVEAIGERFPQFHQLRGQRLLDAIKNDPVNYIEMMSHSKAYRQVYNPDGSRKIFKDSLRQSQVKLMN